MPRQMAREDSVDEANMSEAEAPPSPVPSQVIPEDSDADGTQEKVKMVRRFVNPLSIRFSQAIIYRTFHDGRNVSEAVDAIRAHDHPQDPGTVKLVQPFPFIRVLRGQRSLTYLNDNNAPQPEVLDCEDYLDQDLLFTIDNRRLYALQKAAIRRWPKRCLAEVWEMERLPYKRHAKKFDNYKDGHTVQFGSGRGSSDISMWCSFKNAEEQEVDMFLSPIESILALAKLAPAFLLIRDRVRPFLVQESQMFLIGALVWSCVISWVRMFVIAEKFEHRLLQHHVLDILNSDSFNISDSLPAPVANALGCPRKRQGRGGPQPKSGAIFLVI